MDSLLIIEIALPARALWTALRRADAWFEDRVDAFDDGFALGATAAELAADSQLCERLASLIGTTPGLAGLLRDGLGADPMAARGGLRLVFLHDDTARPAPGDPDADTLLARSLLAG
ncbi:ABC transporter related protein [Rhodobacter sp. CZR27]|uniref:ABC transporter related protein n=1 Tax=Rhodobacter sp. CZR27 TaxID=2033869 RepID=UPI000BBF0844|nr:ABC transporter related protein [Rhodobacter sp. CZR27]